jgi:hypothetical protein
MLDTVALTLNSRDFIIYAPEKFTPSAEIMNTSRNIKGRIACTQQFKDKTIYYPRLTLSRIAGRQGSAISLRVEASLPKLVYGNNFDELTDGDLPVVLRLLQKRLEDMGVQASEQALRQAGVSAIHFSKNILLGDYATCSMIITELQKVNVSKRLDISRTTFLNGGIAVKYHANCYEIIVYDKWADLQQSKISSKRGLERDYHTQHSLLSSRQKSPPCEVLRLEIRFGRRTPLKAILKTIDRESSLTLEALFNAALSQAVLLHYWQQILDAWDVLSIAENAPEDVLRAIMQSEALKSAKAFQLTGALLVARSVGIRGLRTMLDDTSDRMWQKLRKQLEALQLPSGNKLFGVAQVMRALEKFAPLRSSECIKYAFDKTNKYSVTRSNFVDGQGQHGSLDDSNLAKRQT